MVKTQTPYKLGHQQIEVAGTGFATLDRLYSDGSLTDEALGGSCGNVLISLAMLHRNVAPVLVLGLDETGERLVCEFSEAGAVTKHIHLRSELKSPVLAHRICTSSGEHDFSFSCPETSAQFPVYQSIGKTELDSAHHTIEQCAVFYADRLSASILEAMEAAWSSEALIFFEPSDIEDEGLFVEALKMTSILKYSEDRLGKRLSEIDYHGTRIVTHGAAGLEIENNIDKRWCEAVAAPHVTDTCGAGDMVTVGLIDWMLSNNVFASKDLSIEALFFGVLAGQRLAAENCAFAGARGLFKERGSAYVREVLST